MKERGSMPYDVVAFETDEDALALTEKEEGLFHRIMRKAWINGSVPADLDELAILVRTRPSTLRKAWPNLSKMWQPIEGNETRLRNKKLESERIFKEKIREANSTAGKLSAKLRKLKKLDATGVERASNERSTSPLPSPLLLKGEGNKEEEGKGNGSARRKRAERPQDEAVNYFASQHLKFTAVPYVAKDGDFVQLVSLRKAYGIGTRDTPPGWVPAVENYFRSSLGKNSIADLVVRYSVFHNSPVDGFNKPINHQNRGNGNGTNSKTDRNAERTQDLLRDGDQQDRRSNERGTFQGDDSDLFRASLATNSESDS